MSEMPWCSCDITAMVTCITYHCDITDLPCIRQTCNPTLKIIFPSLSHQSYVRTSLKVDYVIIPVISLATVFLPKYKGHIALTCTGKIWYSDLNQFNHQINLYILYWFLISAQKQSAYLQEMYKTHYGFPQFCTKYLDTLLKQRNKNEYF